MSKGRWDGSRPAEQAWAKAITSANAICDAAEAVAEAACEEARTSARIACQESVESARTIYHTTLARRSEADGSDG